MAKKFSFTKNRCIAFIFTVLLPLLGIGLGLFLLAGGIRINRNFAITFIFIPVIGVTLLALCIFSRMQRIGKVILSIFLVILFVIAFLFSSLFVQFERVTHYTGEDAAKYYTSAENVNELMPSLSEIGNPLATEYIHFNAFQYIFLWDADYLICRYSPDKYELQKQKLEEKYSFREEPIAMESYEFEPTVEIDGYRFRVLDECEEYETHIWYPKYMVLVGYSDETQEIVYVSFFDTDLDYITSLTEFLQDECGWNYVR